MGIRTFFDTYALIAIIESRPSYEDYAENEVVITFYNLVELYYIILRQFGETKAKMIYNKFKDCVCEIPPEVIFEAMNLKLKSKKSKLSYADCIGYSYARKEKISFLTGDKEFEKMDGVEYVK